MYNHGSNHWSLTLFLTWCIWFQHMDEVWSSKLWSTPDPEKLAAFHKKIFISSLWLQANFHAGQIPISVLLISGQLWILGETLNGWIIDDASTGFRRCLSMSFLQIEGVVSMDMFDILHIIPLGPGFARSTLLRRVRCRNGFRVHHGAALEGMDVTAWNGRNPAPPEGWLNAYE